MYSWSSPAVWTFGAGVRGDELKQSTSYYAPGPGTYDETSEDAYKKAYPQWKVGTGNRPDLYSTWNKNIGPGSYEVAGKAPTKAEKKTFSKAKKEFSEFKKATNPVGPGSYFPKKFTQAPPVFSFGYKSDGFQLASNAEFPGPGTYDIKNVIDEAFEKSMRPPGSRSAFTRTAPHAVTRSVDPDGKPGTPGPGYHYNPEIENYDMRYFTPTWSFGRSNRDDLYNDETKHVPGPGNYQIPSALKTKTGFTILGKHQKRGTSSDTPGPNVYKQDIAALRKTAPSFRIGKAERKNMAMGNAEIPGPGTYYEEDQTLGGKGTRIGTSQRRELHPEGIKKNPGPGEYEINGTIGKSTKYSMGIKGGAKKVTEVLPGPGEYEPYTSVYLEKNIGGIIGTSQRPPLYKRGGAPGPGQYDVRGNIGGSTYKIGTGKRAHTAKNSDEPGPGFYNIPSAIGNVPKYLRAGYAQEAQEKRRAANAEKDPASAY